MTTQTGERRKVRVGRVVSDRMDKTVVVAVERRVRHRLYGKSIRHVTKFKAHDEANAYQVGDMVRIVETRPLSKTKRWRVTELLVRQAVPDVSPEIETEVVVTEAPAVKPRRRGPTRAAQTVAAKRAALAAAPPAEAKAEEPEEPQAETEEAPVAEAETAEAEEEPTAEEEAPAAEAETAEAEEEPTADEEAPVAEAETAEAEEEPTAEKEKAPDADEGPDEAAGDDKPTRRRKS